MKLVLLLAAGCMAMLGASRGVSAQRPGVTIERVGTGSWRATYRLPRTVHAIRFDRPAAFYRERVWHVSTPGYRFTRQGDWQVLSLDSGATAQREIVFEFPEFTDPLPKEYELFQPFTDGARALYTGHFHATAIGEKPMDSSRVATFRIPVAAGEHAIVRGEVRTGLVSFTDSPGDGTYVYIGTAKPIETADMVAIVDPGMPAWLGALFSANLPRIFHEYATRLGVTLPHKPVVYYSFSQAGSGRSSGGGTLEGLINMTLSGNDWRAQSADAAEQALALIAHESAHMWNGQVVANASESTGSWMHEGSADAMANDMLRIVGTIDSARHHARREEALNRCVAAVQAGSVETALRRGSTGTVYSCGFVMAMWTEALLQEARPGASLFTFWRTLIARSRSTGSYDEAAYYATLESFGVADSVMRGMRRFLSSTDSASIMQLGLESAGIPVRADSSAAPSFYRQGLARSAFAHVMQQACGRVSFSWADPVRSMAVPSCAPFSRELLVHRVQNLRVRDEGAAVYDAIRAACAAGQPVTLGDSDGAIVATVPCTKPLPPRAPWYRLGS